MHRFPSVCLSLCLCVTRKIFISQARSLKLYHNIEHIVACQAHAVLGFLSETQSVKFKNSLVKNHISESIGASGG